MPTIALAEHTPIGTVIVNTAEVSYNDKIGKEYPKESSKVETTVTEGPSLTITKVEDSNPVEMGASLTYTINYKNSGTSKASNVKVIDYLSKDVIFKKASDGGEYNLTDGTVTWNIGTLNPSVGGTLTITTKVKTQNDYASNDPDKIKPGTIIKNTSKITSNETSNETSIYTKVDKGPNLEISESSTTGNIKPGGKIRYCIKYKNTGNNTATNVQIKDIIPEQTELIDGTITAGGKLNDKTLIWEINSLNAGKSGEVSFAVKVSESAKDENIIKNTSKLYSNELDTITSNQVENKISTTAGTPKLSLNKIDSPNPVCVGNTIKYTIQVTNDGTESLTNILIKDPIPNKTEFIEADEGGIVENNEVKWTIPNLLPNETKEVHFKCKVKFDTSEGSQIQNTAYITADEITDPTPSTSTTVSERTKGQIEFQNKDGDPQKRYKIGQDIYIQVKDLDRNTDPDIVETIKIVLKNIETGDQETITLTETGPSTGFFIGSVKSNEGDAGNNGDGSLTLNEESKISATYEDALDAEPVSEDSALIDPYGIVFDSASGGAVKGAVVTLYWDNAGKWDRASNHRDWPKNQDDQVTTGEDGKYQFPLVPEGSYFIDVNPIASPPDYKFPSVVKDSELPSGFIIGQGSRRETFTLKKDDPPLNLDIPVDPPPADLKAEKRASKNLVSIGEFVQYTIKITNNGQSIAKQVNIIDTMPHGIQYYKNSAKKNKQTIIEPKNSGNRQLVWNIGDININESVELSFVALIGVDSLRGDGNNLAYAEGRTNGKAILSNTASVKIKITEGVFTSNGTIIGKVFIDKEEKGVPDVVLYLEDGTRVVTDKSGKYSIPSVKPGTHVIRLDETSLPKNLKIIPFSNRFMGNILSQFVDITPGGLSKANFSAEKKDNVKIDSDLPKEAPKIKEIKEPVKINLEKDILNCSKELEILSPKSGDNICKNYGNIVVKAPMDVELNLYVNNEIIKNNRIGKKLINKKNKVAIYEYVAINFISGSKNHIKAQIKDMFGNIRGIKEIDVLTAGEPEKILIKTDKDEIQADGKSTIKVKVLVLDKNDLPIDQNSMITADINHGEILEKDADSYTPGIQIPYKNNEAIFNIKAPSESNEAIISVLLDNLQEDKKIFFSPHLRDTFIIGYGEITIGHGKTSDNFSELKNIGGFKKDAFIDGQGKLFLKKKLGKDMMLTAAYDSEKDDKVETELFKSKEKDPESEDKYPIYGDESKITYEAQSKNKLYVKLEKNKSYLLYGDYKTDLTSTSLSTYQRALNGLKYELNTEKYKLRSFASYTNQTIVVDKLRGMGISGFYYLTNKNIVEGSERVTIETRDRYLTDRVLKRESKSKFTDYEIDYEMGYLVFKEAIPSHDGDFNPIFIIVSYESISNDKKYLVYGGRGSINLTNWIEVGATAITEEHELNNYNIYGADLTFKLPGNSIMKMEYANTDSFFETNNIYTPKKDSGWLFNFESKPIENFKFNAFYKALGDYYGNPSAIDATRGTIKYGYDLKYLINPSTTIRSKYFNEKDEINNTENEQALVGVDKEINKKIIIHTDLLHENNTSSYLPPNSSLNDAFYNNSDEKKENVLSAKFGAEYKLRPDITIDASHKQDILHNIYQLSQAGIKYQFNKSNRLAVREEYGKYDNSEELRTVFGVESQVSKNTVTYNEYRLIDGIDGQKSQNVIGIKNNFLLGDRTTGNLSSEYQGTIHGKKSENYPDAFAISGGLEFLPKENLKFTNRLEYRNENSDNPRKSYFAELGIGYKLSPEYSILVKERYFLEDIQNNGNRTTNHSILGLAYRPLKYDKFNALFKFEYKQHRDLANNVNTERDTYLGYNTEAYIVSTEGIYQPTKKLQLIGKYAGKLSIDDAYKSYIDLISGRIIYDITERFDMGLTYRILTSHKVNSVYHGGSVEFGYRIIKDLWLSLGYSFDNFDADLTGADYWSRGPYLKLRLKFDENSSKGFHF
ncbi:MAG: DUF11 domain-containing protein [Desulfobacterales bacterium]|nr:DUF11 domain-containing protein [Desulfobacterales bacterium]